MFRPPAPATSLAIVGLLLAGSGCGATVGAVEPAPAVIGVDLPLTGAEAALGEVYRNALVLRVEQVNQRTGAGPRRWELSVVDNRSEPAGSASNLAEFAADARVAAIVTGGSGAVAAVEAADAAGVPTIALAAADEVASPADQRRYVFKLGPNAADNADLLAAELSAARVATVGLVAGEDAYGADGVRELTGALAAAGVPLVVTERIGADVDDAGLAAAAARIAAWVPEPEPFTFVDPDPVGPEAVVLWLPQQPAAAVAVGLRQAGFAGGLYLDAVAAGDLFVPAGVADVLRPAWMVFTETLGIDDVIAVTPAKAERSEWFRAYLSRYGTYHAAASLAADAVDVIAFAVERVDSGVDVVDRELLRGAIEASRLDGLTGPLGFSPTDHSGLDVSALRLLVLSGDRWRLPVS